MNMLVQQSGLAYLQNTSSPMFPTLLGEETNQGKRTVINIKCINVGE
jgi:hypothetical protein